MFGLYLHYELTSGAITRHKIKKLYCFNLSASFVALSYMFKSTVQHIRDGVNFYAIVDWWYADSFAKVTNER